MKYRSLLGALPVSVALVDIAKPAGLAKPGVAQVGGYPGDATVVVCPAGAHPAEVTDVQWALDNMVLLKTVVMKSTNIGGAAPGNGEVIELLQPDITLTGDGWDDHGLGNWSENI